MTPKQVDLSFPTRKSTECAAVSFAGYGGSGEDVVQLHLIILMEKVGTESSLETFHI